MTDSERARTKRLVRQVLTAEHDDDTAEIRALLQVAREIGPGHLEFAGLVRGAEILRTLNV